MSIQLRRLLLGETRGDYNFLRYPNRTTPSQLSYQGITNIFIDDDTQWLQEENIGTFAGGQYSLHPRFLRVSYAGGVQGVAVSHVGKASALPVIARFGLGAFPVITGSVFYVLGNPNGVDDITPTGPGYYQLSYSTHTGWWRFSVEIGPTGGTLDLDELRVWEYLDIEDLIEELFPHSAETEVFQMPAGRYFVGSHYRVVTKRVTLTLLVPQTYSAFRKQLEEILTPKGASHPLELFIDDYLFRCAPAGYSYEWLSGAVLRYIIDLQLLQPHGYHQDRKQEYTSSTTLPFKLSINNPSTVETPCEVRVNVASYDNPAYIEIYTSPTFRRVRFSTTTFAGSGLYSMQEDGRLVMCLQGTGVTVQDITSNINVSRSHVPLMLAPGWNEVTVVFKNSANQDVTSTVSPVVLNVTFNPRTDLVSLL